jgi:hypothetical protein
MGLMGLIGLISLIVTLLRLHIKGLPLTKPPFSKGGLEGLSILIPRMRNFVPNEKASPQFA